MRLVQKASQQVLGILAVGIVGALMMSCSQNPTSGTTTSSANLSTSTAKASTISWKGHTWNVSNGGMAGVINASPNNVSVDSNGYLHLKIVNSGGTWTGAEIFSQDNMGFGTYQWQIQGPVDNMDKHIVFGLFPYGPAAGIGSDGTNEIDIEFSKWNGEINGNADFTYYPASGSTVKEYDFTVNLGGSNQCTARTEWSSTSIRGTIMNGFQPIGSTTNTLYTATYSPSNPTTNIPQKALPLGINLWSYGAAPSAGVEVIIQDFQFVAQGSNPTTYNITASAGTGGTISPSGTVSVTSGGSKTFTITPNSGYTISSVTVDGSNKGAISSYTFSNVTAAHTISATFTANTTTQYTITASAGTGGTISPSGSVKVNQGASQAFTIAANSGYTISSVSVDGANQGAISSYTFSNVQAAHTISATFTAGGTSDTNIAPSGTGYIWSKNTSATSNSNKTAKTAVNDGNLTTSTVINASGEGGSVKYEAAGVTWTTAKTISSVKFINGTDDGYGNGYFQSAFAVQFTTDGTTWTTSSWTVSPAYPNSSSAYGQTYTFTGTAVSNVKGVRVVGAAGASSWSGSVIEVQAIGH